MIRFFKTIHRYAKKLNSSSIQLLSNLRHLDGQTYFTDGHILVRIENPEVQDGVTLFSDIDRQVKAKSKKLEFPVTPLNDELSYPEVKKLIPQEKGYPVSFKAGTLLKLAELAKAYKDQDQVVTIWLNEENKGKKQMNGALRFDFVNQFSSGLPEVVGVISTYRVREYE